MPTTPTTTTERATRNAAILIVTGPREWALIERTDPGIFLTTCSW